MSCPQLLPMMARLCLIAWQRRTLHFRLLPDKNDKNTKSFTDCMFKDVLVGWCAAVFRSAAPYAANGSGLTLVACAYLWLFVLSSTRLPDNALLLLRHTQTSQKVLMDMHSDICIRGTFRFWSYGNVEDSLVRSPWSRQKVAFLNAFRCVCGKPTVSHGSWLPP
eukprot:2793797-Pleurochrysis_carterae.AAC.1